LKTSIPLLQGMPLGPYMVAYNYGSVVFFAAGPRMRSHFLGIARQVAQDPVSSERPYMEGALALQSGTGCWSAGRTGSAQSGRDAGRHAWAVAAQQGGGLSPADRKLVLPVGVYDGRKQHPYVIVLLVLQSTA
jgi:hypothetical protein